MTFKKKLIVSVIGSAIFSTSAIAAVDANFSGQINRGILAFDDGKDSETRHVDNDASSSRFRFTGSSTVDSTTVGINFELEAESNNTRQLSQGPTNGGFGVKERILEFVIMDDWGKLFVGQGPTASDGTSEKDLSGTALAGWSDVATHAGGLKFRNITDVSGDLPTGPTLTSVTSNFDGLSRNDRIRYDSPSMGGLNFALGHTDADDMDIAANYSAKYDTLKLSGALAYAKLNSSATAKDQLNGSLSVALNGGLNLTIAGGKRSAEGTAKDPKFSYAKLGYISGDNRFSVDFQKSEEVATNAEVNSIGVQYVRAISAFSTEAYVGIRNYELKDQSGANQYEDITAALIGARVKF